MMVNRTEQKGIPPAKASIFPNWVDVDAVFPLEGQNTFRRQLGLETKLIALYSGNMGNKQGLESLEPLARAFTAGGAYEDSRVHFLFCGDGAFRPQLEELVGGLSNVTMLDLQPMSALNELLNAADVHLLPQRAGAADLVMPSKLTGMFSSGRAVLATADPGTQIAKVVGHEARPCGLVVPAGDEAALQNGLNRLVQDAALRELLAETDEITRSGVWGATGCWENLKRMWTLFCGVECFVPQSADKLLQETGREAGLK